MDKMLKLGASSAAPMPAVKSKTTGHDASKATATEKMKGYVFHTVVETLLAKSKSSDGKSDFANDTWRSMLADAISQQCYSKVSGESAKVATRDVRAPAPTIGTPETGSAPVS